VNVKEGQWKRSGPIYGSYSGCKSRSALTPTAKLMYQTTITVYLIHPAASDCNMQWERFSIYLWINSEGWSFTLDTCCQNKRLILQWTVFYFLHSFMDIFIQLDAKEKEFQNIITILWYCCTV
jgi:hypothetical protein